MFKSKISQPFLLDRTKYDWTILHGPSNPDLTIQTGAPDQIGPNSTLARHHPILIKGLKRSIRSDQSDVPRNPNRPFFNRVVLTHSFDRTDRAAPHPLTSLCL